MCSRRCALGSGGAPIVRQMREMNGDDLLGTLANAITGVQPRASSVTAAAKLNDRYSHCKVGIDVDCGPK